MFVKWRTAEIDLAGPIEADTLSSQPNKLGDGIEAKKLHKQKRKARRMP